MAIYIQSYCKIKNGKIWVNDALTLESETGTDLPAFLSETYRKIELAYPKFFKMDLLCKLGVLGTEFVIRNNPNFLNHSPANTALIFSNRASSLETDRQHAHSISDKENYFPSPAVFVYTLPNIVLGEIAIKHKLQGENAFFVSEKLDAQLLHSYTAITLENTNNTQAICGWVEVDGNNYEAFVISVEQNESKPTEVDNVFSVENLQQLFSNF